MTVKVPETHTHKKCLKIAKVMNKPLLVDQYKVDCRWCEGLNSLILQPHRNRYYCSSCKKSGNLDDLLELVEREVYGVNYPLMSEKKGVNL